MAAIPLTNASGLTGAAVALATSNASDTVPGGQGVHLLVQNTSGSPVNVTLVTPETVEGGLAVDDRVIAVANNELRVIPVPSRYNNPATGVATVNFSAPGATVTRAAFRGSATP